MNGRERVASESCRSLKVLRDRDRVRVLPRLGNESWPEQSCSNEEKE